ncbi:hypothetical protein O3M35_010768 [Rhynocoris fuscipes]|uniref:MICOS complex subunit MIC13 n=1 Tax=Rhynocoris fuscipes TaxID=488301 RepID=A0AAW1D7Y3_9HEMI
MGIIRFGTKVVLMSGVCYVTSQYGIWRDSRRSEEIYKEIYTFLAPHIKEVPLEIPELPKSSEVSSAARVYWNRGVVSSAEFIANVPLYCYNLAEKGVVYVSNVLSDNSTGEQKQ